MNEETNKKQPSQVSRSDLHFYIFMFFFIAGLIIAAIGASVSMNFANDSSSLSSTGTIVLYVGVAIAAISAAIYFGIKIYRGEILSRDIHQ